MRPTSPPSGTARRGGAPVRAAVVGVSVAAVVLAVSAGTALSQAASPRVPLGTAASFVVLAGSGITNTGATTLGGDLGTYPTPAITNTGSFTFTSGTNRGSDGVTQGAKTDLDAAYVAARDAGPSTPLAGGTVGGRTLTPGVYSSASTIGLTGTLTLDGEGNEDAVFIFQAGSGLTTASASRVLLEDGASACNVFWQVGSSATLGTDSHLVGTVLAQTSITLTSRATVQGRVLARGGAVTLDSNTISRPVCQAAAPEPEPSAEPEPTATPEPTAEPEPTATAEPTATPTASTTAEPTPTPTPSTPVPATPPDQTVTTTGITTGLTTTGRSGAPPTTGRPGAPSTTTSGGTTSQQITRVPAGGVPAGDGSASVVAVAATSPVTSPAAAGLLGLLGLSGTAALAARRRRRDT